jgi:hypothetical protein
MSSPIPHARQTLQSLLETASQLIWRGDASFYERQAEKSGFAELDALLPGSGWPVGAITELIYAREGMGEVSLLLPVLARLTRSDKRIAMVAPPHIPYAPALVASGIELTQLMVIQPDKDADAWWTAEQLLRSHQFAAVLFWPDRFDERGLRRLQSAAERGSSLGFVFHQFNCAEHASPAPLRLRVTGAGQYRQALVAIIKRRGSVIAKPVSINLSTPSSMPVNAAPQAKSFASTSAMPQSRNIKNTPYSPRIARRKKESPWKIRPAADTLSLSTAPDR